MSWRNFLAVSTVVTILHYLEDISLIWLGRFTDVDFIVLLFFPIGFGILLGGLSQVPWIRRFFNGKSS